MAYKHTAQNVSILVQAAAAAVALQALAELVAQVPRAASELLAAGGPRALAGVLADDYAQGQLREGAAAVLTALVHAHRGAGAAVRRARCGSPGGQYSTGEVY